MTWRNLEQEKIISYYYVLSPAFTLNFATIGQVKFDMG